MRIRVEARRRPSEGRNDVGMLSSATGLGAARDRNARDRVLRAGDERSGALGSVGEWAVEHRAGDAARVLTYDFLGEPTPVARSVHNPRPEAERTPERDDVGRVLHRVVAVEICARGAPLGWARLS